MVEVVNDKRQIKAVASGMRTEGSPVPVFSAEGSGRILVNELSSLFH